GPRTRIRAADGDRRRRRSRRRGRRARRRQGPAQVATTMRSGRHMRHARSLRRVAIVLSFVVSWTSVSPLRARADDVSIPEHIKRFARDGVYVAASPLRLGLGDLLPLALVGGAIGATIA